MTYATQWLTEQQAAEHVGRNTRTVATWRLNGDVEAYRQGGGAVALYHRISLENCAAEMLARYVNRDPGGRPRNQ